MKLYLAFLFFVATTTNGFCIDREAFTIARYDLEVQVDRPTHVMAVTGRVTLRNDSKKPQKVVALQISSSFAWNSISLDDKPVQWLSDNYTTDIDHTGSVTEAVITLPTDVPPLGTITLALQYGGTVTPDATRLTRIGTPADMAARSDWDQISDSFTALRGFGYVIWYPLAVNAVSMSDGNAVFDAIAAWKQRHAHTDFKARVVLLGAEPESLCIATNASSSVCGQSRVIADAETSSKVREFSNTITLSGLGEKVPTFSVGNYVELSRPTIHFLHVPDHTTIARDYAIAAEANDPLLREWLGDPRQPVQVIELTQPDALPYESGSILFSPLRPWPTETLQLLLIPTQVSAHFASSHLWIEEGLQQFLQAVSVESRSGRKAAMDYLNKFHEPLAKSEEAVHAKPDAGPKSNTDANDTNNTLLNTNDELYLRGKGSFVFWMLRDMLGDAALQSALTNYHSSDEKDPSYLQRLLQASSKRDLEWFFDDWVYRDRGLPEFRVDSAYARPLLSGPNSSFLETVTIENRGRAGAEVPVLVQAPSGEKTIRIVARGGGKGTGRIEIPVAADKIVVDDGSVPDQNLGDNVYEVPPAK